MNTQARYFSLVSDRIEELKSELDSINVKLSHMHKRNKAAKSYLLEKEFILRKISYLEKLVNLPLYMSISNLSEEELKSISSSLNIPASQDYLIHLFGLESIAANFGKHKLMTMAYLKDSFITDYDFMTTLLYLQGKNFDLTDRNISLLSYGLIGFRSIKDLNDSLVKVNSYEERLNQNLDLALSDYDIDTLMEIFNYIRHPETKLSREFILKHVDKVSRLSPEMKKLCGYISYKGIFSSLGKPINFKRNKKEAAFMNGIIEAYRNDGYLKFIELDSVDFSKVKKAELKDLAKKTKRQVSLKQEEILKIKSNILDEKKRTLREVQRCDAKKNIYFVQFATMLHSKHSFVPKMFEVQMWNEPDLKESLMKEACYLEEKELIARLSGVTCNIIDFQDVFKSTLQEDTKSAVRKLIA